ncbi:MAG TPA: hypothetical protein VF790_05885 [Dissulfurispiraceae bacterium]
MKESCPGSREIKNPYPEELICAFCTQKNEIWTDEPDTVCKGCGRTITRDMAPSCIEWCPAAKECVGADKYEKLIKKLKEQSSSK